MRPICLQNWLVSGTKQSRSMRAIQWLRPAIALVALLVGPAALLTAQGTPQGILVCPNGTSSGLADTATNDQFNAACGISSPSGSSTPSAGPPLSGQALRNQMNQQLLQGMTNSFMQGAIHGFMNSLHRSEAMRRQQELIFQQQMQQQQQQAMEQQQLAEQQHINAMFARLNSELKFGQGLESLHMKGMDGDGSDALHMKLGDGDATADSYGIQGLPGLYVGGPAGGATTNSGTNDNAAQGSASGGSNPNLASGPGSGTTGPGIPGLPGIYLDGAQPEQAAPLAQAAQTLPAGPERDLEEDTALHAAQNNPALTAQTQDPQVQQFQQTNQNYQQELQTTAQARQQLAGAQSEVTADQSAIATAKAQLASLQPTEEQQAALQKMLDVAKSDEAASETARKMFEDADAHLSIARTQAIQSLARTAPPASNAGALLSGLNTAPHLLRAPQFPSVFSGAVASAPGSPVAQPATPPMQSHSLLASSTPSSDTPPMTHAQLCAQLVGAQTVLRRLIATEAMQQEVRTDWEEKIQDASDNAMQHGFDMVREFTGNRMEAFIRGKMLKNDKNLRMLRAAMSAEPDADKRAALQQTWDQLQQHREYLKDVLERAVKDQENLDKLATERDTKDTILGYEGTPENKLDAMQQTVDDLLANGSVQTHLGLSDEGMKYIEYTETIKDSGFDILSEALGAQRIAQMNQNSAQMQEEEKRQSEHIRKTVAQLNAEALHAPPGSGSCSVAVARK